MNISQRLYLAVVPAIVGLFTVASLAYWGDIGRAAPEWLVVVCAVSTLVSLVLAWQNTRYVARRIARLAPHQDSEFPGGLLAPLRVIRSAALPGHRSAPDEFDSIEDVVDHLSNAVTAAEAGSQARVEAAARRVKEYAVLLAEASAAVSRQIDEVRIPIHILLDNHFGELNENQEEMLEAARRAAEAAEVETRRLEEVARIDQGMLSIRRDRIPLGDLLRSLVPQLEADAAHAGVALSFDIPPGVAPIAGDRVRLHEALELLLRWLVHHATAGAAVGITLTAGAGEVTVAVSGAGPLTLDPDTALARRVLEAHGGRIDEAAGGIALRFPTGAETRR